MSSNERDVKFRASFTDDGAEKGFDDIAAATQNVESALARAQAATQQYAAVADSGLPGVSTLLDAAKGSTEGLATALEKAKAIGAPVNPEAGQQLEAFRAVLNPVTKDLGAHSVQTAAAKEEYTLLRAALPLASRELGPFGSSLRALTKDQNEWVSGVASSLIPLAAFGGAIAVLDKALNGLRERGLDIPSLTGAMGKALDELAIALGGTSKATQEALDSFQKAQKSIEDLDKATVSYKSGIDLIVNAGLDLKTTLVGTTEAANAAAGTIEALGTGVISTGRSIADTIDQITQFNKDVNAIRITSPVVAAQLTHDFIQIEHDIASGVDGASAKLDELTQHARSVGTASEETMKQIEGTYGKDGPKAFAIFSEAAGTLEQRIATLQARGMSTAQAMTVLKGQVDAAALGHTQFAGILAVMNDRTLPDTAARIHELAAAHTVLEEAIRKFETAASAESIVMQNLTTVLRVHSGTISEATTAYFALKPAIDGQIAGLEGILHSTGSLNEVQAAHLGQLLKLREANEGENVAIKLVNDAVLDQTRKLGDLGKRFDDLTKSYEKQRASIIATADAQVAAAQRGSAAVAGAVDYEIANLDRASLGNAAYAAKIAELQNKKVEAWRDAEGKTTTIQEDERSKLEEIAVNYGDATAAIQRELGKQNKSIQEARDAHVELEKQVKITTGTIVEMANRHSDLARSSAALFGGFDTALKQVSKEGIPAVDQALKNLSAQALITKGDLDGVAGSLTKISISNTGGAAAGADEGAGGTPGSEGG